MSVRNDEGVRPLGEPKDLQDAVGPACGVFAGSTVHLAYERDGEEAEAALVLDSKLHDAQGQWRAQLEQLRDRGEPREQFDGLRADRIVELMASPAELYESLQRYIVGEPGAAGAPAAAWPAPDEALRRVQEFEARELGVPGLFHDDDALGVIAAAAAARDPDRITPPMGSSSQACGTSSTTRSCRRRTSSPGRAARPGAPPCPHPTVRRREGPPTYDVPPVYASSV